MPRYKIPLTAGQPINLPYLGRMVQVMDTGAAATVGLALSYEGDQQREDFGQVARNFRAYSPVARFNGLEVVASVDCTLDLIVTMQRVEVDSIDGANVTATLDPSQLPLPVVIDGPSPLSVVLDGPVSVAPEGLPATYAPQYMDVTDVSGLAFFGDETHMRVVIHNHGPGDVAIARSWPGVAFDRRAIVLSPGQTLVEERFAGVNMPWSPVCRAGETARIGVEVWSQFMEL